MANKSIPKEVSKLLAAELELSKLLSDRSSRTSILISYIRAVSDVVTTVTHNERLADGLEAQTIDQLKWLQLELADQADAVINGHMPTSIPCHEQPWIEGQPRRTVRSPEAAPS